VISALIAKAGCARRSRSITRTRPELDRLPFLSENSLPSGIRTEVNTAPLGQLTGLYQRFHEAWFGAADGRLRIAVQQTLSRSASPRTISPSSRNSAAGNGPNGLSFMTWITFMKSAGKSFGITRGHCPLPNVSGLSALLRQYSELTPPSTTGFDGEYSMSVYVVTTRHPGTMGQAQPCIPSVRTIDIRSAINIEEKG
jgi:hypothetical protein